MRAYEVLPARAARIRGVDGVLDIFVDNDMVVGVIDDEVVAWGPSYDFDTVEAMTKGLA